MIGVPVGEYWQITTNLHFYADHIKLLKKRIEPDKTTKLTYHLMSGRSSYGSTLPLIEYPLVFDEELLEVMTFVDAMHKGDLQIYDGNISNTFLRTVVLRMAMAHFLYKNGGIENALDIVDTVSAEDWRQAGHEWLERRNVKL
jgi:hypothetical protein